MSLQEAIQRGDVLVLDGAMGTQLIKAGRQPGGENNLTHPDAIKAIHQAYVDAGANILLTNTLTLNRIYVEGHSVACDWVAANRRAVQLARSAVGTSEGYVLGDIGPSGQLLQPLGLLAKEDLTVAFREQAELLGDEGVDGYIVETMYDLDEALCALRACRQASHLPVFVSLSFSTVVDGGRTMMGNTVAEIVSRVQDSGGDVVGANCGELDPAEMAQVVRVFAQETRLPVIAQPNAGKPVTVDGQTSYNLAPVPFAQGVMECVAAGARLVGGCCGTSPQHIQELVRALAHRAT